MVGVPAGIVIFLFTDIEGSKNCCEDAQKKAAQVEAGNRCQERTVMLFRR